MATPFVSSTEAVPDAGPIPRHIAIIMDGNGRWAKRRRLPRVAGHQKGRDAVRETVKACGERGVEFLTLFAFSSENWRRPADEVSVLMQLFLKALEQEVAKLHENNIRFKVVGDLSRFDRRIVELIGEGEALTAANTRLTLTVAANYGGRWDIVQAINRALAARNGAGGPLTEAELTPHLSMSYAPEPDLFIRTGGEQRISNFLIWQSAYAEIVFDERLWPEFGPEAFDEALLEFARRTRRFGR